MLNRDQKRLLAGYYRSIEQAGVQERYDYRCLFSLLDFPSWKKPRIYTYFDNDKPNDVEATPATMKRYGADRTRLIAANRALEAKEYITVEPLKDESIMITLTIEGFKLGEHLSTKFGAADVWYRDHRDGLGGLFLAFVAGLIGGVVSHLVIKAVDK